MSGVSGGADVWCPGAHTLTVLAHNRARPDDASALALRDEPDRGVFVAKEDAFQVDVDDVVEDFCWGWETRKSHTLPQCGEVRWNALLSCRGYTAEIPAFAII